MILITNKYENNWNIQSSAEITDEGEVISMPDYQPEKWYPATMPSTVMGTLAENELFADPYYRTNTTRPIYGLTGSWLLTQHLLKEPIVFII